MGPSRAFFDSFRSFHRKHFDHRQWAELLYRSKGTKEDPLACFARFMPGEAVRSKPANDGSSRAPGPATAEMSLMAAL